jgi:hypothetical protein
MPERSIDFINLEQFLVVYRPANASCSGADVTLAKVGRNTKVRET